VGAWAARCWGAGGIAAANAVGISVTALLLLHGAGGKRAGALVSVRAWRVLRVIAAQTAAAVCACGAGLAVARRTDGAVADVVASGTAVGAVFVLVLGALRPRARAAALRTALRAVRRAPPPVAPVTASPAPTRKHRHAP
jgi:putative peptidoglycan lipid II flippase